jgi:hypothetical protein
MSGQSSVETAAAIQILAQEILDELGVPDSGGIASRIAVRLEAAVNQFLYRERERCVAICKKRAALWSNTAMASSPLGRDESRARTNEASYIADAIRSISAS